MQYVTRRQSRKAAMFFLFKVYKPDSGLASALQVARRLL